jgi:hypothetical protein
MNYLIWDVKFNRTVNNVKEIKVLNKTASGKSADVEIKSNA